MNRDAVDEYVEQSEAVLDSSPQMDEANTKAAILRDFLELLDWQIPQDTQLEYPVQVFSKTYHVDYALILEGTPVAFFEAKGVDSPLKSDHEVQLSDYMKNKDVDYGILSNGKEYRFYQRRVNEENVTVQKIIDVKLNDLPNWILVLNEYTKPAIEKGGTGELERINDLREARQTLVTKKDELAAEVTELLNGRVSETISSLTESQSKELIDRLVADIESEIDADGGDTDDKKTDTGGRSPDPTANHIVGQVKREEIEGDDDAKVAVFPTKVSGVEFLRENNAWGFVKMAQNPEFVAMYVSEDVQEVKYVARFKDTVPATEADTARPKEAYFESGSDEAQAGFDPDEQVVVFEPESLYELENPVPFETKFPMSLQYSTLGALRSAETTDDML